MNRLLFASTTEKANGFTGHYKLIPNRISGSRIQLALPGEVAQAIEELLTVWEGSAKDFQAIADFHARFEHIHPFQNGNGRIGRFLMLKQCIESDIDIIAIDEEFERPYKAWLEVAQADGDTVYYYETLRDCRRCSTGRWSRRA